MTLHALNRLTLAGAGLLYFAVMGGVVALALPALENYRAETLLYVMLPSGILGALIIAVEKSLTPDDRPR